MGGTRVGLVAMIVLSLAAGFGEAQEIGRPGRGLALAQRLCSQCHAVGKEQTQSPNENSPPVPDDRLRPGDDVDRPVGRARYLASRDAQYHA